MTGLWLLLACGDNSTTEETVDKTTQQVSNQPAQNMNRPIPPKNPTLNGGGQQNGPAGSQDQVPVKTLPNLGNQPSPYLLSQIWVPNRPSALTTMAMVF